MLIYTEQKARNNFITNFLLFLLLSCRSLRKCHDEDEEELSWKREVSAERNWN